MFLVLNTFPQTMQGWLMSRWISACRFTLCFVSKFLQHTEQEYFPSADLRIIVSMTALRSKMFQNQSWNASTTALYNIPTSIKLIRFLHFSPTWSMGMKLLLGGACYSELPKHFLSWKSFHRRCNCARLPGGLLRGVSLLVSHQKFFHMCCTKTCPSDLCLSW